MSSAKSSTASSSKEVEIKTIANVTKLSATAGSSNTRDKDKTIATVIKTSTTKSTTETDRAATIAKVSRELPSGNGRIIRIKPKAPAKIPKVLPVQDLPEEICRALERKLGLFSETPTSCGRPYKPTETEFAKLEIVRSRMATRSWHSWAISALLLL